MLRTGCGLHRFSVSVTEGNHQPEDDVNYIILSQDIITSITTSLRSFVQELKKYGNYGYDQI